MSYSDSELRGVGGWLAFLVIVLAALTPIRIVVSTLEVYSDPALPGVFGRNWGLVQAVEIGLSVLSIAFSLYLAWRLNSVHTPRTIRLVIPGLWILSLGVMAAELIVLSILGGLPIDAMAGAVAPELFRGAIFAGVWTAYLLKSERVANTYAEPEDEVSEVFV
jgi:hypothetical protein